MIPMRRLTCTLLLSLHTRNIQSFQMNIIQTAGFSAQISVIQEHC